MLFAYPVVHLQLCCRSQTDGPPLFGSLGCVDGKRVLGLIQYWHQYCHFIDEYVEILDRREEMNQSEGFKDSKLHEVNRSSLPSSHR